MHDRDLATALREGGVSRRQAFEYLGALGIGLALMPVGARARAAEGQALSFTWSGYDVPELFGAYAAKHGAPPDFSLYADGNEAFNKVRAGFKADIAHPCIYDIPRWVEAGAVRPIDTAKLSNWPNLVSSLVELPNQVFNGERYFIPIDWGATSITYRTDLYQPAEESWAMLWDESIAGKISVIDSAEDTWWAAGLYAGLDMFHVKPEDEHVFETIREALEAQKPLLRFYSSDMTSVAQALASGEIVAAMSWNNIAWELAEAGVPVKVANPKEGQMTWTCGAVLLADAPNPDKAYDAIDSLISAETGQFIVSEYGYGHSNKLAYDTASADVLSALGMEGTTDPTAALNSDVFIIDTHPEVTERATREFLEIKAGI
jgi:spermidine/putrescine transport system substrate-binding protein